MTTPIRGQSVILRLALDIFNLHTKFVDFRFMEEKCTFFILLSWTLIYDLERVTLNQHAKYLGQWSFHSKVIPDT